eukprot:746839-Hanusia_phi.AAC.13
MSALPNCNASKWSRLPLTGHADPVSQIFPYPTSRFLPRPPLIFTTMPAHDEEVFIDQTRLRFYFSKNPRQQVSIRFGVLSEACDRR